MESPDLKLQIVRERYKAMAVSGTASSMMTYYVMDVGHLLKIIDGYEKIIADAQKQLEHNLTGAR